MYEVGIEQNLIILDSETIIKLFSESADAVTLYVFYHKQAKMQKTNQVYATKNFCMKGLGRGETRISKAKNLLKKYGLIEDYTQKDSDGKIKKWYIKINYMKSQTPPPPPETTPVAEPVGGFQKQNAYSSNNINAYSSNKKTLSKDNSKADDYVPKKITIDIDSVIKGIKEKMKIYSIVYDSKDERMFGKHILSKKRGDKAKEYGFNDGLEFAKFVVDCSMQKGNWRQYKVCSIKILYQKHAQIINEYQKLSKKQQSNVGTF